MGESNNIDWSNDLILSFIHRRLISDNIFIEKISSLLSDSTDITASTEEKIKKKLINKIMYYKPNPNRLRCGDIMNIKDSNNGSRLAIIVSPDCDIANENTRHIELVELRNLEDDEMKLNNDNKDKIKNFNHQSYYFFPSLQLNGEHIDFVAILKSKVILTERVMR